ncbi:MAG: hypothetical protein F6K41_01150 [Symploca sp. SIO3E6]|nr:hypothetical protein [Caldora sp. SIO3E6]
MDYSFAQRGKAFLKIWKRRGDAGTRGRGDEEEEPQFFDSLVVSIYGVLLVPKSYI